MNYKMNGDYVSKVSKRKNIRFKKYDYSQTGYYFITICTKDKKNVFWKVGETCGLPFENPPLSNIGEIVDTEINNIYSIYENVEINKYVVMPNHIHLIIILYRENGRSKTSPTISLIIQQFKGSISKRIGFSLWQKSFYDHIIRNEQDYKNIYKDIEINPFKWDEDKYHI